MRPLARIGRNERCPCGSGKKYKHCHGSINSDDSYQFNEAAFQRKLRAVEAENAQRKKQQGLGKPIISADFNGWRIIAVGNQIFYSKEWKTFHDFLRHYIFHILGREWVKEQRRKPAEERHQIIRWFDQAMRDAREMSHERGGVFTGPMTGAQRAFLTLAYNLYLIAHHSDPEKADAILDSFVWRLKSARNDDFIGKLFETYASAAFLKAGFHLDYENERDGNDSHVEFVATYPQTGKNFSVEVKARNPSDGRHDNVHHPNIWHKVKQALRKSAEHERVVFVEVNIPDVVGGDFAGTWAESALDKLAEAESYSKGEGGPYPPAYVIITNHAYHNNLESSDVGLQAIATGYRIPKFGPRATVSRFKYYLEYLDRHKEMLALFDSLKTHSQIPATFDGEIPEFAFGPDEDYPRLKIGHEYIVPNADGEEARGVLENAIVMESWGKAQGLYRLRDGSRIMVSHELTENELSAWKRHPETFFGQIQEQNAQPKNWLELAEFMYRTYQTTSKDKLLEFMSEHDDIKSLMRLDQEELAITYCERMAWSMWNEMNKEPLR